MISRSASASLMMPFFASDICSALGRQCPKRDLFRIASIPRYALIEPALLECSMVALSTVIGSLRASAASFLISFRTLFLICFSDTIVTSCILESFAI